jgi:hypothetical protein
MLIECATCRMRGLGCGECVVTALLGEPPGVPAGHPPDLDERERRALAVLADAGLISPAGLMAPGERAS